jgi:ribosomal protein S10
MVLIKFDGVESRLLDVTLQSFCKLLQNYNINYLGPLPLHTKKIAGNTHHFRTITIDSDILQKIITDIQNFDFPPSINIQIHN